MLSVIVPTGSHVVESDCEKMQCPTPESVPRPNGRGTKDRISVPCGKCIVCLSNRRKHWSFRLEQECKNSLSAFFITLTYDNTLIPFNDGKATLKKSDLIRFLKVLRSFNDRDREKYARLCGVSEKALKHGNFKYYAVGEYGTENKRPHYHLIVFGLNTWYDHDYVYNLVYDKWAKGFVHVGSVTPASITYVAKYLVNSFNENYEGIQKPFSAMSKGLGLCYVEKTREWHEATGNRFIFDVGGVKKSLPRYFKEKIFPNEEADSVNLRDDFIKNGQDVRPILLSNLKKTNKKKSKL